MRMFLALVHHPCVDRGGNVITTALTNVDVHDIGRSARTYGAERLFIVTPVTLQQTMVAEMVHHWTEGEGLTRNDRRAEAMSRVTALPSVAAACEAIAEHAGQAPLVVATSARMEDPDVTWLGFRERLRHHDGPVLILFGTGWGMAPELVEGADVCLPAIVRDPELGPSDGYNHLSVRAAAAIALDRLLGA